jgi:hypothetical protein
MTKSNWTIDVKTHRATHSDGTTVDFSYFDGGWSVANISAVNEGKHQEALSAWCSELEIAINHLVSAGEALYGRDFINPLAKKIGVNRTTIQRWLSGETPLTMGYPKWADVILALKNRAEKIVSTKDEISMAFNAADTITSGRYAGAKIQEKK